MLTLKVIAVGKPKKTCREKEKVIAVGKPKKTCREDEQEAFF